MESQRNSQASTECTHPAKATKNRRRAVMLALGCSLPSMCFAAQISTAQAQDGFAAQPQSGIKGALLANERKLWLYDKASGKYVETAGDASGQYKPDLRKPDKPLTFAYADGWATIPFAVSISKNVYRIADELGIKIIYCDQEFKAEKAVTCAEQLSQQKPDFAIVSNWQVGAAEGIMKIYDAAKIPVANVDVWHPNGIYFGAENYASGAIAGRAAGERAKSLGKCAEVTVFTGVNPGEGEAAHQRIVGFTDGVQEVCGKLPEDRLKSELFDAGTTEQALTKTTDWLTANPGAGYVLSTSVDDARAVGIAKALAQNARDGAAVSVGCDDIGIAATKEGDPADTKFYGCVAFYPEKYPDFLMSIGLDVIAGKPVPNEVHIEHQFLDRTSISSVYP